MPSPQHLRAQTRGLQRHYTRSLHYPPGVPPSTPGRCALRPRPGTGMPGITIEHAALYPNEYLYLHKDVDPDSKGQWEYVWLRAVTGAPFNNLRHASIFDACVRMHQNGWEDASWSR